MKAFFALLQAGVVMLRRNRVLLISSLGLALIFGWLFGGSGTLKLRLGVVNDDTSPLGARVLTQLQQTSSLQVFTGSQDEEMQALRNGSRNAVLVLPASFGVDLRQGHTTLQVYYDESNPVMEANTRAAAQTIVTGLNEQMTGQAPPVTLHEQAVSVHNLRQIDWLTPGMLGMLLMWANLSIGVVLVQWRQMGILRRLAATPVRPGILMATQMLARLVLSVAQGAILIAVAMLVFHVQVIGSWGTLLLVVILGVLTMMALGFVAGSFTKTPEATEAITFLVSFPMMFLGGSYFPTDNAPAFLAPVVKAMPLSYLNDALRQIINNGAGLAAVQTDLLILVAWMVAALLLSGRAFRWS
jgi:ABC-2 type transport system permease protein